MNSEILKQANDLKEIIAKANEDQIRIEKIKKMDAQYLHIRFSQTNGSDEAHIEVTSKVLKKIAKLLETSNEKARKTAEAQFSNL